jgi:hypothetical protein
MPTSGQQDGPGPAPDSSQDLTGLLALVARGDHAAFEAVYGLLAGPVYGVARKVLRDPGAVRGSRPGGHAGRVADHVPV